MRTSIRIDRAPLLAWYRANRERSAQLFRSIAGDAFLTRPIPLRHPPIFYEGHIPAFSYNKLGREALGMPSVDATFEVLFERGIDPATATDATAHAREDWPSRADVQAFGAEIDRRLLAAVADADIEDGERTPLLEGAEAVYTILEHEELHHETLLYLIAQLADDKKQSPFRVDHADTPAAGRGRVEVAAGETTLGGTRGTQTFGWDNEFDGATYEVARFEIDVDPVTNGEYLRFVDDGGPVPPQWVRGEGEWLLRCTYETIPLPRSWPVYATNEQARAYAAWRNARLPSEAEYQRAAYGSPGGEERRYPWGDASPAAERGNFGFRRFDPEPVGATPAGASAWGVRELAGNGWEWTSTPFGPLPGFRPMPSYPKYSADFFDDRHYVVKGASPVTSANLLRPSFRNWYYGDYPYMFAKFRTVAS